MPRYVPSPDSDLACEEKGLANSWALQYTFINIKDSKSKLLK